MRLTRLLFVTLRDDPADAEVRSHALMARTGFLQKVAAGIYVYGPMLWRTLRKIEQIVREEHDRAGCQELLMPALQPRELWEESGRWDRYVNDGILFHLQDRKGAELCLGPTHEEVITTFVKRQLQSYKQLPLTLYQIQTKFRDEIRPRFGLMRGREFIMKDAYSFDATPAGMKESYQAMRAVYTRVFTRCGLRFTAVEADPGAIGGSGSEEFMVDADTGEDAIAVCRETGYAANVEKATGVIPPPPAAPPQRPMHKEPTPGARSCEDLQRMFPDLPIARMLKTVLYRVLWRDREGVVAVMCRGDRALNEVKLANFLDALKVELADEKLVRASTGAEPGFAGPIGLGAGVRLVADRSVEGVHGFLCGGNETDTHYLDVWFGRDLPQPETADFGQVQAGDLAPGGQGALEITRGIEVGHIFQLGTKYSEAMECRFVDEQGRTQPAWMGCYGIGISRVAAAAIEQNHDEAGMIWPLPIAPYSVLIVQMKAGDAAQDDLAAELHEALEGEGVDVLWDDRPKVSPGAKFKDADLIGIPLRIVVGRDASQRQVEWKPRRGGSTAIVDAEEAVARVRAALAEISGRPLEVRA
ncbi:MAG: proline--tRNA ligase [Planctomycetota bacterium]|nr:MAG: proline--tRNA ligase [Planctomycetota bacterium]